MGNSLANYLSKRLKETSSDKGKSGMAGPVITISREVGCNGIKLANKLAAELNLNQSFSKWRVLSKEIFYESAKELDLEPEKIRQNFKKTDRFTFEQILKAFGDKRFKSDAKIAKTVRDVVRSLAIDGHNIIVGRASHIIASDINNALHIRLTAPLEYRISNIMHNNHLNKQEAIAFIQKVEKERYAFRKAIKEESLHEEYFDMWINRASFNDEEAISVIMSAVKNKKILAAFKPKMEFY